MPYISTAITNAWRGAANIGVFVRVDTDDPIRVWFGLTKSSFGIDAWDGPGTKYYGAGLLASIPDQIDVMINGLAARWEVGFKGVDSAFLDLLEAGATTVKGRAVHIGIAPLDANYAKVADIIPIIMGYADFWALRRVTVFGAANAQQQVLLSVGAGDTARRRPARVTWTSTVQKLFSPLDTFCDRVVRYVPTYLVAWPRFIIPFLLAMDMARHMVPWWST